MEDANLAAARFVEAHPDWRLICDEYGDVQLIVAPGFEYVDAEDED